MIFSSAWAMALRSAIRKVLSVILRRCGKPRGGKSVGLAGRAVDPAADIVE